MLGRLTEVFFPGLAQEQRQAKWKKQWAEIARVQRELLPIICLGFFEEDDVVRGPYGTKLEFNLDKTAGTLTVTQVSR